MRFFLGTHCGGRRCALPPAPPHPLFFSTGSPCYLLFFCFLMSIIVYLGLCVFEHALVMGRRSTVIGGRTLAPDAENQLAFNAGNILAPDASLLTSTTCTTSTTRTNQQQSQHRQHKNINNHNNIINIHININANMNINNNNNSNNSNNSNFK